MNIPVVFDSYARLRNSIVRNRHSSYLRFSTFLLDIVELLYQSGYIAGYKLDVNNNLSISGIIIYFNTASDVFRELTPISKPSNRVYSGYRKLMRRKYTGYELTVLTTNRGVLTRSECILQHVGGEVLFILQKR